MIRVLPWSKFPNSSLLACRLNSRCSLADLEDEHFGGGDVEGGRVGDLLLEHHGLAAVVLSQEQGGEELVGNILEKIISSATLRRSNS